MSTSGQGNGASGVWARANFGRRFAAFAGLLALLSFLAFQSNEAQAQGRGEDERLNLFLDTEGLIEQNAEEAAESAEAQKGEKPGPATRDLRRNLGGKWQIDPIFLKRAQTGKPIDSMEELRDPLFGVELRRQF